MLARVLIERLKLPVGTKVTDFVQKDIISEAVNPNRETHVKKEELTLFMSDADEQKFTSMLGEKQSGEEWEVKVKKEELTLCMTEADEQEFT
jgi:hypothetical protein